MMRNFLKAAMVATAVLGGLAAAAPAAAQGRYDRGGYDNDYRGEQSRWNRHRGDRYDRGHSWRRDRDDDRRHSRRDRYDDDDNGGRHRHWRGRDR